MSNRIIFIKYFKGTASQQEKDWLHNWLQESEANRQEFVRERQAWDMLLMNTPTDVLEKTLGDAENARIRRTKLVVSILKYAALALVLISSTWYFARSKRVAPVKVSNHTISVPVGQRVQLTLADGSVVWLNSKSVFTFPNEFNGATRDVTLNGEAYFEVAHNKEVPFIVHTSDYAVRVFGTVFNVCAYSNSKVFETSLLTGSVAVAKNSNLDNLTMLKPNEKAFIKDNNIKVVAFDSNSAIQWKDGVYFFDGVRFADMLERLERYYNVTFEVKNTRALQYECTGKFRQTESIKHILDVVKADNHFRYKYDEVKKKIIIL